MPPLTLMAPMADVEESDQNPEADHPANAADAQSLQADDPAIVAVEHPRVRK